MNKITLYRWAYRFLVGIFVLLCFTILSNKWIINNTKDQLYSDVNKIPYNNVGLVLGTSKYLSNGMVNPYFKYRMQTAAELYHNGKIKHILVSGDNHLKGYDEATDMRDYLVQLGVPEYCITMDYAGFRTFDSVVRAREVFGLNKMTIISQEFHNQRAVFLCNKLGIEAIGMNAKAVLVDAESNNLREHLAKFKAVLDLYVLGTEPHFYGPKITINVKK